MKGNWFSALVPCPAWIMVSSISVWKVKPGTKAQHDIARSVGGCDTYVHGRGATVSEL